MTYNEKITKILDLMQKLFVIKGKQVFLTQKLAQFDTKKERALYCAGLAKIEMSIWQELVGKLPKNKSKASDPIISSAMEDYTSLLLNSPDAITTRDNAKEASKLIREIYELCLDTSLIHKKRDRYEKYAMEKAAKQAW